jgi:hypothetical protein
VQAASKAVANAVNTIVGIEYLCIALNRS